MAVSTYTKSGNKATTSAKLDKSVFGIVPTNHQLLKQAYVTYLSNGRTNNAKSLKRGEVSGGGKKPWKQKGTGRARAGSSRNPIWRGGGIAFGPTGEENYTKKMNTTAKRLALRQALSIAAENNMIIVIEDLSVKDQKTSEAVKLLNKIGASKKVLIVTDAKNTDFDRSISNLKDVKLSHATYLNVFDLLNADSIVITTKALELINKWLGQDEGKA
jgi:large subunit ribosomal protein L4